jgi:phosphoglycolate phosphatase
MTTEKLSRVRALIFDLDGTLIDSQQDLILSVKAMLDEIGRPDLPEEIISGYIGHGAPRLVRRALGENATEEELERALQFFLAYYEEHKLDNTCPYPGVAETLAALSAFPMAVCTNKPAGISVRILDALGLSGYFRVVYGGNSFGTKKPDPYGTHQILKELNASAEEVLFIGDSDVDVQTARNAGTIAAIAHYGFGVYDGAVNPADVSLNEFGDLIALLAEARPSANRK